MKLHVVAVGRLKAGAERDLITRYATRMKETGRALHWDGPHLVELTESSARRDQDRKSEEARAILAALPCVLAEASQKRTKTITDARPMRLLKPQQICVLLDERGETMASPLFAQTLEQWQARGIEDVHFVLGGADGLDQTLRDYADKIISFGAMTLPHQLVRVLILEQLYRAATILSHHPYHRV